MTKATSVLSPDAFSARVRRTLMIRVLMVDDEHLVRAALAQMLSLEDDIDVVAEAGTAAEGLVMAQSHTPVLDAAADGADVEEIARRVHLSPGTVRNYLSSASAKLGAVNRHQAAATARRMGWL